MENGLNLISTKEIEKEVVREVTKESPKPIPHTYGIPCHYRVL